MRVRVELRVEWPYGHSGQQDTDVGSLVMDAVAGIRLSPELRVPVSRSFWGWGKQDL